MLNAKDYLMQIRKLDCLIKNKQEEVMYLEAQTVRGDCYEGDRVQTSVDPHSRENLLIKIIQVKQEIRKDIFRLTDLRQEVMKVIDELDDVDEIDVLYKRYLYFNCWEQIAIDKGVSIRHIYRIHGQALLNIGEILRKLQKI